MSPLNDGAWHTVKYTFTLSGCHSLYQVFVDGKRERLVLGRHRWGIGTFTKRFGMIGDGSEAEQENGLRNHQFFHGDIRAIHMKALSVPLPDPPMNQAVPTLLKLEASDVSIGNEWVDRSGNNNSAVPSAGVGGTNGQYYSFNGQNYFYIKNLHFEMELISNLDVEVVFRTAFNGTTNGGNNWAFLDFDNNAWFSTYVRNETHTAAIASTGADGVQDEVYGTTALNDNEWHTVRYTFALTGSQTSRFEIFVDGASEKIVENLHPSGMGSLTRRFGFVGDSSEAPYENGLRNGLHFVGDIKAITLKALTWSPHNAR
jgi:hypothetical protein